MRRRPFTTPINATVKAAARVGYSVNFHKVDNLNGTIERVEVFKPQAVSEMTLAAQADEVAQLDRKVAEHAAENRRKRACLTPGDKFGKTASTGSILTPEKPKEAK